MESSDQTVTYRRLAACQNASSCFQMGKKEVEKKELSAVLGALAHAGGIKKAEKGSQQRRKACRNLAAVAANQANGYMSYGKRSSKSTVDSCRDILATLKEGACTIFDYSVGHLLLIGSDKGLRYIDFVHPDDLAEYQDLVASSKARKLPFCLSQACDELSEYFAGERETFSVPLDEGHGTAFQNRVWQALKDIPYGQTLSYGGVAKAIGQPSACRAVANSCGRNPHSIIVPCHRVVGSNSSLTGFGGGVCLKSWLLEREGWEPKKPKKKKA